MRSTEEGVEWGGRCLPRARATGSLPTAGAIGMRGIGMGTVESGAVGGCAIGAVGIGAIGVGATAQDRDPAACDVAQDGDATTCDTAIDAADVGCCCGVEEIQELKRSRRSRGPSSSA